METITNRLAGIFASEPDDAAKVCAFLAVLYLTTLIPLLTWAVFKFNSRSRILVGFLAFKTQKMFLTHVKGQEDLLVRVKNHALVFMPSLSLST